MNLRYTSTAYEENKEILLFLYHEAVKAYYKQGDSKIDTVSAINKIQELSGFHEALSSFIQKLPHNFPIPIITYAVGVSTTRNAFSKEEMLDYILDSEATHEILTSIDNEDENRFIKTVACWETTLLNLYKELVDRIVEDFYKFKVENEEWTDCEN